MGTTFTWDIFLGAHDTHGMEESFASLDGLWFDTDCRVFIQTDGVTDQSFGGTFALSRSRFIGSYFAFNATRRSKLAP